MFLGRGRFPFVSDVVGTTIDETKHRTIPYGSPIEKQRGEALPLLFYLMPNLFLPI